MLWIWKYESVFIVSYDILNGPFKQLMKSLFASDLLKTNNSHLLPLHISHKSIGEKSLKYQTNVILSLIVMTTLFYNELTLQGEIWCWSLLGFKGLKLLSRTLL